MTIAYTTLALWLFFILVTQTSRRLSFKHPIAVSQTSNTCRPNGHLKKICRPNVCRPNVLSPKRPYTSPARTVGLTTMLRLQWCKTQWHYRSRQSKVNAKRKLLPRLIEECKSLLPSGFICQQDDAPAHTKKLPRDCIATNCSVFIGKGEWPPNSSDVNLLDYHICGVTLERYKTFSHAIVRIIECVVRCCGNTLPGRRRLRSSFTLQLLVPPYRLSTVGRRQGSFPRKRSVGTKQWGLQD